MGVVAERAATVSFADVAGELQRTQADALAAVNACILDSLGTSVPLIAEVARHLISAGGKRLRPVLTLASASLCGGSGRGPQALAAAVELIHAATLLHDDVVDDSALRRGLRTANVVFGNKESVLVGDFLFARAFELMVTTGSLRVLDILSRASCTIAEGEVLQLATQADLGTNHATYLRVIGAKTAALFAAATEAGAVVAGAEPRIAESLGRFGQQFGIAYQLVDDALDYVASEHAIGKSVGDDFREGKMTLPVILALEHCRSSEDRAFWQRTIGAREQHADDLHHAQTLIHRDGIIGECLTAARRYADQAVEALQPLPRSPLRSLLVDLALSSVSRRH